MDFRPIKEKELLSLWCFLRQNQLIPLIFLWTKPVAYFLWLIAETVPGWVDIVMKLAKKCLGFEILIARPNGEIAAALIMLGAKDIYVACLGIGEGWRRQGNATRLLEYACKKCLSQGGHRVSLGVRRHNLPALNLYLKTGFGFARTKPFGYLLERNVSFS